MKCYGSKRKRSHLNLQDVLPFSLLAQSQLLRVGMLFVSLMQHFIFQHCCIDAVCKRKKDLCQIINNVRTMYIDAIYYDEFILLECLHIYTHKHINTYIYVYMTHMYMCTICIYMYAVIDCHLPGSPLHLGVFHCTVSNRLLNFISSTFSTGSGVDDAVLIPKKSSKGEFQRRVQSTSQYT